jgi:DUF1680 family protein
VETSTEWNSVAILRADGLQFDASGWEKTLYSAHIPATQLATLTAIPYCLWDNRAPGEMRVWLPV